MKKGNVKGILIGAVLVCALGAGGYAGFRYMRQNSSSTVEVVSVAEQNMGDYLSWGDDNSVSGTVVSDVNQEINLPTDKVIEEVYVNEGDPVKIGDKLLSYDTTLLELDQELQELTVMELQMELKSAEADLEKLRNTAPGSRIDLEDSGSSLDDFDFSLPEDDDDEMASVGRNSEMMRTAAEGQGGEAQPQETAGGADTQEAAAAAENTQEPSQNTQETTQNAQEPADTQNTETQETVAEETVQEETASENNGGELIVGGEEMITLDPQNGQEALQEETQLSGGEAAKEDDGQQAKMNQSTEGLFTHLRVKLVSGQDEPLLADTREAQDGVTSVNIPQGATIKLIPHFAERADRHFERQNTYVMLIKGLTLEEDISGKVYGTAQVNGKDYPEIGGYMLTREPADSGDIARLTIAFHDGLDTEHEKATELADMYVELSVPASAINPQTLIFSLTGDAADDVVIRTGDETADIPRETEDTQDSTEQETTEPAEEDQLETQEEPLLVSDEAWGETGTGTKSTEESETESDTPETDETMLQNVTVNVTWNHSGTSTNASGAWPKTLALYFYETDADEEAEPVQMIRLGSGNADGGENTDGVTEEGDGDEEPAPDTDADGDGQDALLGDGNEDGAADSTQDDANVNEDTAESENDTEIIIDQNSRTTVKWSKTQAWALTKAQLCNYRVEVRVDGKTPMALSYYQNFSNEQIPEKWSFKDDTATLDLELTYQEPEESPLLLLNPISELTYENGEKTWLGIVNDKRYSGGAYKGSGTKDDPFVFFVTDGVIIRSSFVNWMLGFNAEGTERIAPTETDDLSYFDEIENDDGTTSYVRKGFYVRLEIREADTITGAFIRTIGFDGTVRVDYGYAPGTYWIFQSDTGLTRYDEEVEEDGDSDWDDGDFGWDDGDYDTYTAEQLAELIKEKEREIRKLKLDEREAELKLKQYNKELEESTVVSAVDGYVKSIGGDEQSGEPYMVISSEGGLYLKTSVSELDLDTVEKGDKLTASSWMTGNEFEATITEITYYPSSTSNTDAWGSTNSNASMYPVLAHIEDTTGLSPYEDVNVKFSSDSGTGGSIYLSKAYIRSENGQSYVYKAGDDGRLKKQYIRTGELNQGYLEIKEGLTVDDYIAFPYGKEVKEGAKTKESNEVYF